MIKLFRDYEKKRENERKYQCECCVQKILKEDQGRMSITDETEKLPAVWKLENPEGLYCPKCGLFMPDYENPLDKCPRCGQSLEGWIDGSRMTVEECVKRWIE